LRIRILFRPDSLRHFQDTIYVVNNGSQHVLKIPVSGDGTMGVAGASGPGVGGDFELFQNFPNPFNGSTTFRYVLPVPSHVRLEIFTTIGQSVAIIDDGVRDAGYHNVMWRAEVTTGMYYCRMSASPLQDPGKTFVGTKKIVVIR
jgi:hypothetical protein